MYNKFKTYKSKKFSDVIIIEPETFEDNRGIIFTDYLDSYFKNEFNPSLHFNHSKFALNNSRVLRGIHGDFDSYKLVQCVYGDVFQVIVDCRKDSPQYLAHETFKLSHKKPKMILLPPGYGNAFMVLSDYAVYNYKLSYMGSYNDYDKQFTYKWNNSNININWPNINPILSERDK